MESPVKRAVEPGLCRACIVFAPSSKSPAYELQVRLLQEEHEYFEATGIRLIRVLAKGQSVDGDTGMTKAEADLLRAYHDVSPDEFAVVLLDANGKEVQRYDAPLRIETIQECFEVN